MFDKWKLLLVFILFSCGNDNSQKTNKKQIETHTELSDKSYELDWLVGEWQDTTVFGGKVTFCESWKKNNESSFSGEKHQIARGDTSTSTELTLVKTEGTYYYSYSYDNIQTTFVQDSVGKGFINFINTKDEFPTNLSYKWNGETIKIEFSGTAKGAFRTASFHVSKLNR